jgi:NAD+ kinase
MAVIGLVLHQDKPDAARHALGAAAWLEAGGHEVRIPDTDAGRDGLSGWSVPSASFSAGLDLAVSLGGDGTMLRAVRLVAPHAVPVLGVNLGQLGYLTEVEPGGLHGALEAFLAGEHAIEERMLLEVDAFDDAGHAVVAPAIALNEVVLEKTASGHTVRLGVTISGEAFTTYVADGLIFATPTGSTAYAFSARGPIVDPTLRAMLVTPVSPHMLFDRTLVLSDDAVVTCLVEGPRPAALAIDGQEIGELTAGTELRCSAAAHPARLVLLRPREFHRILKAKFGLSDR